MEDDLKKNGRLPTKIKWKRNQTTKINLIGCDTIVNSPSFVSYGSNAHIPVSRILNDMFSKSNLEHMPDNLC